MEERIARKFGPMKRGPKLNAEFSIVSPELVM